MRRPLVFLSLAALSGVLWGIGEADRLFCLSLSAFILLFIKRSSKGRGRRLPLLFLYLCAALIAVTGYLRAGQVSRDFEKRSDFFEAHGATNPGQFDYGLYLKGEGISSEAELQEKYDGYQGEDPLKRGLRDARAYLGSVIDRYMTADDAGIYKAMLLGDKSDMGNDIKELYQASGISHIIAVSGLHISLVGMSCLRLLDRIRLRKGASLFISGIASVLYVLLTGASGSALRALIMLICRFWSMYRSKSYDMISAIALAMLLLIFARPYMTLQSGFQLSFLAVFGIAFLGDTVTRSLELLFQNRRTGYIRKYIDKRGRLSGAVRTVISNLSVQLMTLPAIAFHFFTFPIYGIALNFAVIPLTGLVMYSGMAVLLAGSLADTALVPEAVAVGLGALGHYILELYEWLCRLSIGLPFNEILLGRPDMINIIVYYLVICGAAILWRRLGWGGAFQGKAGRAWRLRSSPMAPLCLILTFLIPTALLIKLPERIDGLTVTALDVGQGDCFILRRGEEVYMVDGGSDSDKDIYGNVIKPYLMHEGIRRIDDIYVSHSDADHTNGILAMLMEDSIAAGKLILPGAAEEAESYAELKAAWIASNSAGRDDSDMKDSDRDGSISYAELTVPGEDELFSCLYEGSTGEETNDHSPVLLLRYGAFSMLFTGDMTKEQEERFYVEGSRLREQLMPFGVTVLKVGHHGSRTSSSDQLLKAAKPAYALISCGRENRFGHPHEDVVERIARYADLQLRTDVSGAISIYTDGSSMSVSSFLDP